MLPKVLIVCLLELIATRSALAWNHVSRTKFESLINEEKLTLVACKLLIEAPQFREAKLINFQLSRYVIHNPVT
jgi:hypothetical protein